MFHIQAAPPNWHQALLALRAPAPGERTRYLLKSVSDPSILAEGKQVWSAGGRDPASLVTLYRHYDVQTTPRGYNWAEAQTWWKRMFARWVDATYLEHYAPHVDLVSEANEYTASSTWESALDSAWALQNARAAVTVWNNNYRGRHGIPARTRLALLSSPVGNVIPREIFELAIQEDAVIDYHNYWLCDSQHQVRAGDDFQNHSGFFNTLEQRHGLAPRWVFGESGPYSSTADGWRICLAGDRQRLARVAAEVVADLQTTAAYRQDRIEGTLAVFTSADHFGTWRHYQMDTPDLLAIAPAWSGWRPGEDLMDDATKAAIAQAANSLEALAAQLRTLAGVPPAHVWRAGDVAVAVANPLQLYDAPNGAPKGAPRPDVSYDIDVVGVSPDGAWLEVTPAGLWVRATDVKVKA